MAELYQHSHHSCCYTLGMRAKKYLIIALLPALAITSSVFAESKRIDVYSLSQNYWDTQNGDTLSAIAEQLLPNNPAMQRKLMSDIISQNPDAFKNNDPDYMRANIRLWLPNRLTQKDSKANPEYTRVESFSWGNIKRPKR